MILGIDIGTQSLKAVVCDPDLMVRGQGASSYAAEYPRPGWAEQDPRLWEAALGPVIGKALAAADSRPDQVSALALSGQLDGCVPVEASGQPLAPALIWMDRRAEAEIAAIDPEPVRTVGGVILDATHMAAKIRWLQRHGPKDTARYHQPVSYLVERLTGRAAMDHGLASTTMLYSLPNRAYDPELLGLFGIDPGYLPDLAEAAEVAGRLSPKGADLTGLPPGTPVAVGTGDDFASALGAGLTRPGILGCTLGTAEVVGALHPEPLVDGAGLVETHAYPGGQFYIENPGWLSGGAVEWAVKLHNLMDAADLDRSARAAPPGSGGVTFFPALSGAMAPEWNAQARGAYYGLSPAHGTAHMCRAVLEGTAFAMRDVLERLNHMGLAVETLLLSGGGASSDLWTETRCNLTGLPAIIPTHLDGSPLGAVLLAGKASGQISDLTEAAARINPVARRIEPNADYKALYDHAYERYRRLFDALRPLFADWHNDGDAGP